MNKSGLSQKKWKYLSIALMGIIASGILAPTAFAASPTLTDIFNKLTGVEAKVNNNLDAPVSTRATQSSITGLQSDVSAIKLKTNGLPSDPASQALTGSVKTIKFSHTFDPDAGSRIDVESFGILAPSSGKTYAGHITMAADRDWLGNQVSLLCFTGPNGIVRIINGVSAQGFSEDFACQEIILEVADDEPDSGPVDIEGLVQYVVSSDITNIS